MAAGLQVFDQFGNLKVDITYRLLRFVGDPIYINGGDSGSVVNDGLTTGTPNFIANVFSANGQTYFPGDDQRPPNVSFSGNTMFYSLPLGQATNILQMVVY